MTVVIDSRNPRSVAAIGLAVRAGGWAKVQTRDGQTFHGIPSRTEPGVVHIADTQVCTCPDHKFRNVACAHIIAARLHREQLEAKAALRTRRSAPAPRADSFTACRCGATIDSLEAGLNRGRCHGCVENDALGSAGYCDLFPAEV